MKLGKPNDNRVVVIIKTTERDPKTEKITYSTQESFDVFEATPEQVIGVIKKALEAAAK